jgi:hypothetical protein
LDYFYIKWDSFLFLHLYSLQSTLLYSGIGDPDSFSPNPATFPPRELSGQLPTTSLVLIMHP